MYEKAYSKPIGFNDDIVPRVMPNIFHTLQKYANYISLCPTNQREDNLITSNYSFSWSGPRPRIFINDPGVARGVEQKSSRLNPVFHMDKLKSMVPAIQLCGDETLNEWKEMASQKGGSCVLDVFSHLEIFTSAIMAQLMFTELAILAALPSKIIPGEFNPFLKHLFMYLPTQMNRRGKEIDKYVRATFTSMINDRLKRKAVAPSGNQDLLDVFLEDLYEGKITKESERQKVVEDAIGECKIFFFGGFETSSNILTWTIVMLSIHQDWQARAREEVFQALGNKKDITSDDLNKLKIVTMIINETFRLYPPVMELSRLVEEDTKINEYIIPKDSLVTFPILMFHRSTEIWGEDHGEFRPDRLVKAANGEAAFMPFGWGPRICIGMNFSMLESKIFLAMLLREFSFELSPTYTHAPVVAFTSHPQFGAPIVLKKL
ncbi:hypothetical protein Pfo_026325 [Paulownia fortunei]|nr:hypothetical protein Pfo_026325 [Paulownia fortunei]